MDTAYLISQQEGFREFVYDDATGKYLLPGDTIAGHPTVGFGFNIQSGSGAGLSRAESESILKGRIAVIWGKLIEERPWMQQLSDVRRAAIISAAYNLGVYGLLAFEHAMAALSKEDYAQAAAQFRDSHWWRNHLTHNRAEQTASMIETGEWPS